MDQNRRKKILLAIVLVSIAVLLFCIIRIAVYSVSSYLTEKDTDRLRELVGTSGLELVRDEETGLLVTRARGYSDDGSYVGLFSSPEHPAQSVTDDFSDADVSNITVSPGAVPAGDADAEADPIQAPEPSGPRTVLDKYAYVYGINSDIVGWITIDGTRIDYPVMQRYSDDEYYLARDFFGDRDSSGVPFLDGRCSIYKPSSNLIIYGHNMKNGTKFADLLKYENRSYYEAHRYIRFDTVYEEGIYEIIAVFRTRVAYENEDTFKFYEFTEAHSSEEFNEYVRNIKALSLYDTDATALPSDSLVTLTTCEYTVSDGRFVVVGRRIR